METVNMDTEGVQILQEHQIDVKFFTEIADALRKHIEPKSPKLARSMKDILKIMCQSHGFHWVTENNREWAIKTVEYPNDIRLGKSVKFCSSGFE
jgi:hypothetical protein